MRVSPRFATALLLPLLFVAQDDAQAGMYKCPRGGGFEYTDRPCNGDPGANQFKPRQPLNVVGSETLTGRKAEVKDQRPAWLKGPDPIGDCKRKGGTIDPELRACMLP